MLKDLVQQIVRDVAFPVVGDFLDEIAFTSSDGAYDPATRQVVDSALSPPFRCALTKYNLKERIDANGKITTMDRKALIQSIDMPEPPSNAKKAKVADKWYNVTDIAAGTGSILWVVHLRAL